MKKLIKLICQWFENRKSNYLVNLTSNEIHDLTHNHKNCRLKMITHYRLVNRKTSLELMSGKYNGCKYCMKQFDRG